MPVLKARRNSLRASARRTLVRRGEPIPYYGAYPLRGRWLTADYTGLRNAAWAVRNARISNDLNPLALKLVLAEAQSLVSRGEALGDVLEAFAELLTRP